MQERTEVVETTRPIDAQTHTEVRRVAEPTASVDRVDAVTYDPYEGRRVAAYRATQLIYWIFGLIEGLIIVRFVLKALGANPSAGFAEFIYGVTYPLVLPFMNLFGTPQTQGSVLELNSIVALIVYAVVAWLLTKLVWIVMGETRSAIHTHSREIDSRV